MYRTLHNETDGRLSQRVRRTGLVDETDGDERKAVRWKVPWRTMHVLVSFVTIVSGFCTFLPLGYVSKYFSQHCVLYANIKFKYNIKNSSAIIDFPTSTWGEQSKCHFTTFAPVIASIHAFVWGWFFMLMKAAFHRKNHEFSLLIPALLSHIIMCVVVFVCSCYINEGFDVWCKNFFREINNKSPAKRMSCSDAQTIHWDIFKEKNSFYTYLSTARVATWFLTLCVFLQCVLIVYQMYSGIKEEFKEIAKARTESDSSTMVIPRVSGELSLDGKSYSYRDSNEKVVIHRPVSDSPEHL